MSLTKYFNSAGTTVPSSMYWRISQGVPIIKPIEEFDFSLSDEVEFFADFNSAFSMIYLAELKHYNAKKKNSKNQNHLKTSKCILYRTNPTRSW